MRASGSMPRLFSSAFTASRTRVAASPWGVHPLAAGYGIQLGAFLGLLPLQGGGVLPCGKIGFFQRLFLCGQPVSQGGQGVGGQVCHLLPGGKTAAAQHRQQVAGLFGGFFGGVGAAGGGIQCRLPMRQLLAEGVQCASLPLALSTVLVFWSPVNETAGSMRHSCLV